MFFSPYRIAITSLREEGAKISAFRTFVRLVLVWICRFLLPLGVWKGLRFVIVALPGLFSYLFFVHCLRSCPCKALLMCCPVECLVSLDMSDYGHRIGGEGVGCFDFRWFVICY